MTRRLIGRARECAEFGHALDALALGQGGLLVVMGDPGIGKSRFLEEAALVAGGRGCSVAWATCWQGGESRSLSTWSQLLEQLGEELPVRGDPTEDPEESRVRRFDRCVEQLRRLSRARPLLLVVDDLHWADDTSLRLLRHAVGALHAMPVMVAASFRLPLEDRVEDLARRNRSITLAGLNARETEQLVANVVGSPTPTRGREIIHEHTRGYAAARVLCTGCCGW
jgi:predicted ATPase